MSDPKRVLVLWSKTAVATAGPKLSTLQSRIIEETSDITSRAREYFHHAVRDREAGTCYVCTGHELEENWEILVQEAHYRPMGPLPDNHPDPRQRGRVFKFPEANTGRDNEVFALFDDIIA